MAITRYLGVNYGSLILIEYAATQYITAFNLSSAGRINGAGIVFAAGAGWTAIYCSEDNMGHHQAENLDDGGESWLQTVAGFTPGDQDEIEAGWLSLKGSRFICRITRPDGLQKIVGTPTYPLDLKLDSNTQMTIPGAAGTLITFAGATLRRALIYTAG
jgi:hypothetical protein